MLTVDTRTSIETLNSEIICQNYVLMIYFIRPTLISTRLQLLKIMKGSTILQVLKSFQPQLATFSQNYRMDDQAKRT